MKCTKLTRFQFVTLVHTIFLIFFSYTKSKVDAASFGLGMYNDNYEQSINPSDNFFNLLSRVPISIFDVAAMYQNISSTANTKNCQLCRTPVALWVLSSLSPCHDITKEDCPIGLVCCHHSPETLLVTNDLQRSEAQIVNVNGDAEEWNEDEFDPSTFRQDPIPGDPY